MTRTETSDGVKERMREAVANATDYVDDAASLVGRRIESVGETIHESANVASSSLQRAGKYLQEHDAKSMGRDLAEWAKEHPMAAIAAGFGIGFLLARAFSR